ncbi:MAG: hypothetical protein WAT34_12485 [Chitinophagaceae bacterium]|nr:hypothetical protein [Chitinophagaceae bacterium]
MKQLLSGLIFIFALIILLNTGCKTSGYSHALKDEESDIVIKEKPDAISYASIKRQEIPSLNDRATASRGLFGPLLGGAVSLATNAVKKMIAKDRARYVANYTFALTDLYFYDQLSAESVFDPVGMQFSGFVLVRTFTNAQGQTDTAFVARFELDTTSANEIINNSIFRLRLTDLQLRYSKIKMTKAQKNNLNMDIEIAFKTSYVNELGQLFDNVELGKFYVLLREAPVDKLNPAYAHYYDSLKGTRVDGRSFIVPRSFGYYKDANGVVGKSYSQGSYSISVKVTESANDRFVTKVLADNSDQIIDMIGKGAKSALIK